MHRGLTRMRRFTVLAGAFVLVAGAWLGVDVPPVRADGPTVPAGFKDEVVWSGLTRPSALAFAPDGTVFVAEKSGRVLAFSSLTDTTPTLFADLTTNVHNAWDRGLLGLAVDPGYPARPYVYVLYTYDHILGDSAPAPRWGTASQQSDPCPNPPGFTADGCVVSGRLSRLTSSGGVMSGSEHVLVEDWCQQFPSHSVGHLAFGPDGALYASAGDGASFALAADYGQLGGTLPVGGPYPTPRNPCGDPPGGIGGEMTAPTAEGGSLRAQDIRTRSAGDPVGLDGTIIRIDPDTGAAWPANANAADADANARRIIAYGFRNPFRFTFGPDGAVWVADVGQVAWEEINVVANPSATARNFGWPCWEGGAPYSDYQSAGLALCTSLAASAVTTPRIAWSHFQEVVAGDGCGGAGGLTSSSISGLAFQSASSPFPAPYDGALFAADYARRCIWAYPLGTNGQPDPAQGHLFADLRRTSGTSGGPVQLVRSPLGDLLYVDYDRQEIRRIRWYGPNVPPVASFTATPAYGALPLAVAFDASGSTDANPDPLTFAWDLDGDGDYDDGGGMSIDRTYSSAGAIEVGLRVSDPDGLFDTTTRRIDPGNSPPSVGITQPSASLAWKVGDTISFDATASDAEDGTLAPSAFAWTFEMRHCPGDDCHSHVIQELTATKSGSFIAPDHEYPSHLRLTVTVTDSGGMTATAQRDIEPATGTVSVASSPAGIPLTLSGVTGSPPPPSTTIAGSKVSVAAPDSATIGEDLYAFGSWSDGGAQAHDALVPVGTSTITATYLKSGTLDAADTCAAAAPIPNATWQAGRLGKPNDSDWYRFSITSTGPVRVTLGDLAVGARLELYRDCSTRIASVDQGGTTPEDILRTLTPGSYAVRVVGKTQTSSTPYALMVRRLSRSVSILSVRPRIEGSTLRLVGEVYNPSTSVRRVTVTARLYNAAGTLLATRSAGTVLTRVEPGARVPFAITGNLPAGFAKATYAISAPKSSTAIYRPAVTVSSSGPDSANRWTVKGTVRNGSSRIDTLRVGVTLFDTRAAVLDVMRATVGTTTLAPSASTTFSATAIPPGLIPARVTVRALGYR